MKKYTLTIYFLLAFLILKSQTQFSFTLNSQARTSAGVYKKDSTLVRTLWSGETLPAGDHTRVWDGKDDWGTVLPNGSYDVKVLSNNVQYEWQGGRIGNTSDAATGPDKFHAFDIMQALCFAGNTGFFGTGFNENNSSHHKFNINNVHKKTSILQFYHQQNQSTYHVCTDGNYVYWAGDDSWSNPSKNFIFATKVSDDSEVFFPAGNPYQMAHGREYPSVFGLQVGSNSKSGMVVQKNGPYLFISDRTTHEIRVFNKTTGALVQIIDKFQGLHPRQLAMSDIDNSLWVISNSYAISDVKKYTINPNGTLSINPTLSLTGFYRADAIAVSPDGNTVIVADGGNHQQLKGFSNITGSLLWTYGQLGGYLVDPLVANDKFYFDDNDNTNCRNTFIAFQEDGSFWVGDPGNFRTLHFTANRTYIDQIMFMPHSYDQRLVNNDPTRLLSNYLEFKIDYSKPLDNGTNGSWKLHKNWRGAIPPHYYHDFINSIFRGATTFSNGRTYALLINPYSHIPDIVELPATGMMRWTTKYLDANSNQTIYPDGSLRSAYGHHIGSNQAIWYQQNLAGFDAQDNPVWGNYNTVATAETTTGYDPLLNSYYGILTGERTSTGVVVSFNGNTPGMGGSAGYHLGGIKAGTNKWLWKTAMVMPESFTYLGDFPTDGRFDIGNGIARPGGQAVAIDRNIFWGYTGEFWKGAQINKWHHVYDNGLFLGQFGAIGAYVGGSEAPAGLAGQVFNPSIAKVGDDYYLYHNDEFWHSGVHRWKISGLNTINEEVIPVSFALPVTFTSIRAYENGEKNTIEWTVANEVGIKSYEIERSHDAQSFRMIGKVLPGTYKWNDESPMQSSFYRIRANETDKSYYSNVVEVSNRSNKNIVVYPDADGVVMEFKNLPKGVYNVTLVNSSGQVLHKKIINYLGGHLIDKMAIKNSGVYVIQVTGKDYSFSKKLIK